MALRARYVMMKTLVKKKKLRQLYQQQTILSPLPRSFSPSHNCGLFRVFVSVAELTVIIFGQREMIHHRYTQTVTFALHVDRNLVAPLVQ